MIRYFSNNIFRKIWDLYGDFKIVTFNYRPKYLFKDNNKRKNFLIVVFVYIIQYAFHVEPLPLEFVILLSIGILASISTHIIS